jgi:hypothetical protein
MTTMMVLQYVNNISSKEQYMATLIVIQHVNNTSSNNQHTATLDDSFVTAAMKAVYLALCTKTAS